MTISHLAKIPVFMVIGVSFLEHTNLLLTMIFGSVLGSFIGTKLRLAADNDRLILVIKILLSLLAVKMLVTSLMFYRII